MKRVLLLIIFCFYLMPAYAYEVAFPQKKDLSLVSNGIFFVGKVDKHESLWINGQKIQIQKNGSFAESFKLNPGDNTFYLTNKKKNVIDKYIITSLSPSKSSSNLVEFPIQECTTNTDNVILRSTPENFGMNRLGYLPQNTDLQINGIKNDFVRVYLNKNLSGWVASDSVIPEQRENKILGEYKSEGINSDSITETYKFKFTKNLPYSTKFEDNLLYTDVYNVTNCPNETFHSVIELKPPYCYSVKMKDGELSIKLPRVDMSSPKIIIDAGHGGKEPGAVGCMSDLEKDLNLKAAKALKKELKSRDYKVLMTRNSDKYISLKDRVNFTKDKKGIIFISLHMNSIPEYADPNTHKGSETYYYNEFSKPLAKSVQLALTKSLGTRDNGVKQASFAVIRPSEYVGILVETAFLINPEDVEIYKSKDYFKKVSKGVTNGIEKYLNSINQ